MELPDVYYIKSEYIETPTHSHKDSQTHTHTHTLLSFLILKNKKI